MIEKLKAKILKRTKLRKIILLLTSDIVLISLSDYFAFFLRFEGVIEARYFPAIKWFTIITVTMVVFLFFLDRLYSITWSFVGVPDLLRLTRAVVIAFLGVGVALFILKDHPDFEGFPRSIIFISGFLVLLSTGAVRLAKKIYLHGFTRDLSLEGKRILIFGAGATGEQLVRYLISSRDTLHDPIGFIDDDPMKQGVIIHDIKVLGTRRDIPKIVRSYRIDELIIALPQAPQKIIREAVDLARSSGIQKIKILPSTREILEEKISLNHIRDITIEDLLGREPVSIETQTIRNFISGKKILVTGASGSIGSYLCQEILKFSPGKLIAFDQDETGIFNLEQSLTKKFSEQAQLFIIGNICDRNKIKQLFASSQPDIVFHAAAYKHVPLMETQPAEAVKNNIFGLQVVTEAALRYGTEKFVFISCLDEKTKILTNEGLKRWDEVKPGIKTLSLDYRGEIEENEIEEVVSQKYSGPMFQIKTRSIDMLVTPNHKMIIQLPNNSAKIIEEEAGKTVKRSIVYIPKGKWRGIDEEWFSLPSPPTDIRHPLRNCPRKVKTDDILYLLGIFIGDGFLNSGYKRGDGRKTDNYGSVFLDIPGKDKARKRILATLDRMGVAYKCYQGKAGEHIYFSSRTLAQVFSVCGQNATNKTIPGWALKYSPQLLESLLDGLIDSDGCQNKSHKKLTSVSLKLMERCAELAAKIGLHFTVSIQRNKEIIIENRKIPPSQSFVGIFSKTRHRAFNKKHCKQVNYRGVIWCVRVKNNHNFLAERNNKFFFTGNTDKAVNPTSVMGMTKRIGEMICEASNQKNHTKFISVRFGNVLDSRGSVISIFREQIKKGGPVEITHPEMKRYFMVTQEAVLLVMQAGAMGQGGEVFILDMGKPVKILDLAQEMIRLSGFAPDKDIPIVFTKPRPGEKFFEDILTAEEGTIATRNQKIYIARLANIDEKKLEERLENLRVKSENSEEEELIDILRKLISSYEPK